MMPVIFAMVEQLLKQQMDLLQAGKLTATFSNEATTQAQNQELRQPAILQANQLRREANEASATSAQPFSLSLNDAGPALAVTSNNHAVPHGQPVQGVLTQAYHTGHYGLDFGIPVGTPVRSSMDGKVVYAGWNNEGYGNLVIVQDGDYKTYYAHLSKIPVAVGQTIQAGEIGRAHV